MKLQYYIVKDSVTHSETKRSNGNDELQQNKLDKAKIKKGLRSLQTLQFITPLWSIHTVGFQCCF